LHFVSTKTYLKRVQQLGENKKYIFNVGSLGVEAIKNEKLYLKKEIERILKINFNKKNVLVTYHPETLERRSTNKNNFIKLLKTLKKLKNTTIIFTMPNADMDFKIILKEIKKFVSSHKNAFFFKSLGHKKYFTLCKNVDLMIGNSSSGIIEMPSFKKATLNVGDRQRGRVKAQSIIDINNDTDKIFKSINYSYSKKFKNVLDKVKIHMMVEKPVTKF
jgi:UDP-N-acetylglucosamine 2-epimerase